MVAAASDQPEIVQFMISHGAEVAARNIHGLTALDLAAKNKATHSLRLLREYCKHGHGFHT